MCCFKSKPGFIECCFTGFRRGNISRKILPAQQQRRKDVGIRWGSAFSTSLRPCRCACWR